MPRRRSRSRAGVPIGIWMTTRIGCSAPPCPISCSTVSPRAESVSFGNQFATGRPIRSHSDGAARVRMMTPEMTSARIGLRAMLCA